MLGKDQRLEKLTAEIAKLRDEIAELKAQKRRLQKASDIEAEINDLKRQLVETEIQRDKQVEEHAREERELKHMIGLEKKRQEVETDHAKRDAVLTVREENLGASQNRFEEQMKFHQKRFEQEVVYLKDLIGQVLDRLPTVTVDRAVGASGDE